MAGLAVEIPEHDRTAFRRVSLHTELRHALLDPFVTGAGHREPSDVAFDVGHEDGHADTRKSFGQRHQRHRFSRSGSTSHKAVTISVFRKEEDGLIALTQ